MSNIKARRQLSDLYKKGVEVRFGPGPDGEPVGRIADPKKGKGYFVDDEGKRLPVGEGEIAVWVQPVSPLQREMALRDGQAARAKALLRAKREEGSEEHLTILAFLADMTDETLIDYVIASESDTRRNDAMREVLAEDEWQNITEIQDALRQFEGRDPEDLKDDPDYQAIVEVDEKFGIQVAEREIELAESERSALRMLPREQVERKALEKRADLVASQAFMAEYERQMLFYSVRDIDDTGVLFFESARELAEQPDGIIGVIQDALTGFINDAAEAKNSPRAASGSESSEPPSEPEISAASTPETVSA